MHFHSFTITFSLYSLICCGIKHLVTLLDALSALQTPHVFIHNFLLT